MSHKNPGTSLVSTFKAELLELCLAPCIVFRDSVLEFFSRGLGQKEFLQGRASPIHSFRPLLRGEGGRQNGNRQHGSVTKN